jgi:hypothetical protein
MAASRGYVNQRLLLGAESVIGAAVAAVKDFPSLSIEPVREQDDQFYRPAGQLIPGSGVKHREMSRPSWNAGLDYNEIIYILAGLFGAPTTSNPSGSAYQHIFAPTKSNFGTPKTFTVRRGDNVASCVIPGFHFNSLELSLSDDNAEVSGEGFGYRINDLAGVLNATLTDEVQQLTITGSPTGGTFTLTYDGQTTGNIAYNATAAEVQAALEALSNIAVGEVFVYGSSLPAGTLTIHFAGGLGAANAAAITSTDSLTGGSSPATALSTLTAGGGSFTTIAQQPVSKSTVNVYIDSSFGALGTTKFCDALEVGISIPPIRNPVKVLCTAYPDFKDSVQMAIEEARIRMVLIKNTDILNFMSTFNGDTKPTRYVRFEMIGANITGAHNYTINWDFACKCETPEEVGNVQEVYAYGVNARLVADADISGGIKVTVKNTLSGL